MRDIVSKAVQQILRSSQDSSAEVRKQVIKSLPVLAAKNIPEIIGACVKWLRNNPPKSTDEQCRVVIIDGINAIFHAHVDDKLELESALISDMLEVLFVEMTHSQDFNKEWPQKAAMLYVLVAALAPMLGMKKLLLSIETNKIPQHFVLVALAEFASLHPRRFMPYAKDLLAKMLPLLSIVKQDTARSIFAYTLGMCCNAIQSLTSKEPVTPRSASSQGLNHADYSETVYSGIGVLIAEWSRSADPRLRVRVLFAIAQMSAIVPDPNRQSVVEKVVPLVLNGLKKEKPVDQMLVSWGASHMCTFLTLQTETVFEPFWAAMLQAIVSHLVVTVKEPGFLGGSKALVQNAESFLRWARNIALCRPELVLTFFTKLLGHDPKAGASKDPGARAVASRVMQYLLSQPILDDKFEPFKDMVVALLKLAMHDADWGVRQQTCAAIIAIFKHKHSVAFLKQIGGMELLQYLIKHASISDAVAMGQPSKGDTPSTTIQNEIRIMCRDALYDVNKNETGILDEVMWPNLLEHTGQYPTDPDLVNSFPCLSRCLLPLAERAGQGDNFYIDFRSQVNIARPAAIAMMFFAHLFQMPDKGVEETKNFLECMMALAPLLDEPLLYEHMEEVPTPVSQLWWDAIPELISFLDNAEGTKSATEWDPIICRLVQKTVSARQETEWAESFVTEGIRFLNAYSQHPDLVGSQILIICLAMAKTVRRALVQDSLETMINSTDHTNSAIRTGFAKGLPYLVSNPDYVDVVLTQLTNLAAPVAAKKSGGLFGGGKAAPVKPGRCELSRAIAGTALCHVTKKIPQSALSSRVDSVILPTIASLMSGDSATTDDAVRSEVIVAIPLLEQPLRKLGAEFVFKSRDEFIMSLLTLAEKLSSPLSVLPRPDGKGKTIPGGKPPPESAVIATFKVLKLLFEAITSVTNAVSQPVLADDVVQRIYNFVLGFLVSRAIPRTAETPELREPTAFVFTAIINNAKKIDLGAISGQLAPYLGSRDDGERLRALQTHIDFFAATQARLDEAVSQENARGAPIVTLVVGTAIGRLLTRCMDPVPDLRCQAIAALIGVYGMHALLEPALFGGKVVEAHDVGDPAQVAADTEALVPRLSVIDFNEKPHLLDKEITNAGKLLCATCVAMLPLPKYFVPLVDEILQAGLVDFCPQSAACSCVVMHGLLRGRGHLLPEAEAADTFVRIVDRASIVVDQEQTQNGLLVSAKNLAKHFSDVTFAKLLKMPAPHPAHVVKAIQSTANDNALSAIFVPYCLQQILNSPLLEERIDPSGSGGRQLSVEPLCAISCLGHIASVDKCQATIAELRHQIFVVLCLYLGAVHDAEKSAAVAVTVEAFDKIAKALGSDVTHDRLDRFDWKSKLADKELHFYAIGEFLKCITLEEYFGEDNTDKNDKELGELTAERGLLIAPTYPTEFVVNVAQYALGFINKTQLSYRRTIIALTRAMVHHSAEDSDLFVSLINSLIGRTGSDEKAVARKESIAALERILVHDYELCSACYSPIFATLISCFEEKDATIIETAMRTQLKILVECPNKSPVVPVTVNIILRCKAKFEAKDVTQRYLSFETFNALVEMGKELDAATIDQHIHLHLVTFLIHLADPAENVVKTVKKLTINSLQLVSDYLINQGEKKAEKKANKIDKVIESLKTSDGPLETTLELFCKMWVYSFPHEINDVFMAAMKFFESSVTPLRGTAAAFCGYLFQVIPPDDLARSNAGSVINGLVSLASSKESVEKVRLMAVEALGKLPDI